LCRIKNPLKSFVGNIVIFKFCWINLYSIKIHSVMSHLKIHFQIQIRITFEDIYLSWNININIKRPFKNFIWTVHSSTWNNDNINYAGNATFKFSACICSSETFWKRILCSKMEGIKRSKQKSTKTRFQYKDCSKISRMYFG
jgi:hypothetical protein